MQDTAMSNFRPGPGGLLFADIANEQATATVCLQGAQLSQWQPRSQSAPVIFLAAAAQFVPGKSIRGGIPLCWPWFGPHPTDASLPTHGFARTSLWEAGAAIEREDGTTELRLRLTDSDASRALWPHPFLLEYRIVVGEQLTLELVTTNTGGEPFTITEALHTYFNVSDVGAAQVLGLDAVEYTDKAAGGRRDRQSGAVSFDGEVDRVFVGTQGTCTLLDATLQRRVHISKSGSRSTVVWNPGPEKAALLSDLGAASHAHGGWRQLVCVETANALQDAVVVAPGGSHRITVAYRVESAAR